MDILLKDGPVAEFMEYNYGKTKPFNLIHNDRNTIWIYGFMVVSRIIMKKLITEKRYSYLGLLLSNLMALFIYETFFI